MNREELCEQIASMPWEVLQTEPDCTTLVQRFWSEGNRLFDLFYNKKRQEAYEALLAGPWSNSDLYLLNDELERIQDLIAHI